MEKQSDNPFPCPFLPMAQESMSFRNLKRGKEGGSDLLFETACSYSQYLWQKGQPARAILALLRAVYLDPEDFKRPAIQPYRAYRWFLDNHRESGFLGNPRISFAHQATRVPEAEPLKRNRAWALWYLSRQVLPDLPSDPEMLENPPSQNDLAKTLDQSGHPDEGQHWLQAMNLH